MEDELNFEDEPRQDTDALYVFDKNGNSKVNSRAVDEAIDVLIERNDEDNN